MGSASTFESIESYFPLVDKIVKREIRKLSANFCTFEELRAYGLEGLVKAANSFEPDRGISFEMYACKRIRWSLYDGFRKMGWFSRHSMTKMRFLCKAEVEAVHRLSSAVKELASAYIVTYSEEQLKDTSSEQEDVEAGVDAVKLKGALRVYLLALPEKERMVVARFFYDDVSLTEIAREMKISVSWASKLLSSALERLRRILQNRSDLSDRA